MTSANLSGGRDSAAMVVRWLELGNELDYIIFCDTGYEFPQMYSYIDKLDSYLQHNFNKSITRIDSSSEMEKWAFEYPITKGERKGQYRGIPMRIAKDYCTRETKINPTRKFLSSRCANKYKLTALIGYTHAEVENGRVSNLDYAIARYPLHEWGWNEREVSEFLKQRQIMNPLYNHFNRTGCYFCPKQSKASLYQLFLHYPKQWQVMKEWEAKAQEKKCVNTMFKGKPITQYEKEFKQKGGELFTELEFSEFDTCFCGK